MLVTRRLLATPIRVVYICMLVQGMRKDLLCFQITDGFSKDHIAWKGRIMHLTRIMSAMCYDDGGDGIDGGGDDDDGDKE